MVPAPDRLRAEVPPWDGPYGDGVEQSEHEAATETATLPTGVRPELFRAALARYAGGVTVVTAHDGCRAVGMTATAFLSVSLDPPLVLVSVATGSRTELALTATPFWGVSVLPAGAGPVADAFAAPGRPDADVLAAHLPHRIGRTGVLLLDDALAQLECRTEQRVPAGDHTLVVGRVLDARLPRPDGAPLLRFDGAYRTLG